MVKLHLFFLVEGLKQGVARFEERLNDWRLEKNGKTHNFTLRKVELWNIMFEEEIEQEAIDAIPDNMFNKKFFRIKPVYDFFLKTLGIKPIPKGKKKKHWMGWSPTAKGKSGCHVNVALLGTLPDLKIGEKEML